MRFLIILAVSLLLGLLAPVSAQTPGSLDVTFGSDSAINGDVLSIIPAGDGKVYIGGEFTMVRGVKRNRIARLNADGSLDTAFNPGTGADNWVSSVAIQQDGKVLIGGGFTGVNGTARNRIARLNSDGSLDPSFNPGSGANNSVHSVAIQQDGKVLIGGDFLLMRGTVRSRIARLNADGSLDATFDPGTGADKLVIALTVQGDGKVIVVGSFTRVNGTGRNRVARLNANGSLDTDFNPGSGADATVISAAIQGDGRVLIGGAFSNVNGTGRNGVARLNADGSLDAVFNPRPAASSVINAVAAQQDGKVLLGGSFYVVSGTRRFGIARLNSDGSLDVGFDPGMGVSNEVESVAVQGDGKVLIGGRFSTFDTVGGSSFARLNADGSLDITFFNLATGANYGVGTVAVQEDGKVVIAGGFNSVNATRRRGIARLNTDGSIDTTFSPDLNGSVSNVAVQRNGKALISGSFTSVNGTVRNRIARLNTDGSLDPSFNLGTGTDSLIFSVEVQGDGKVLIGGPFTLVNGVSRNRIARLNPDGSLDSSFNPGTGADSTVNAVAVQGDGKIVIGGAFTIVNGVARNRIARLNADGSLDVGFNPGTGADLEINVVAVQADGKVLIAGAFTRIGGISRKFFARLNADGSLDSSFNPGTGPDEKVSAVAVQGDGKLLIGGHFTSFNGTGRNRIARLNADGSLDAGFNPGTGLDRVIGAVAVQGNGKVLIGGDFTRVNETGRNRIVRLHNDIATSQLAPVSSDRLEWRRGGSAPEVTWVEFEFSVDGQSWVPLGSGNRINGGWELTGLNLPPEGMVRASGQSSGSNNSSLVGEVASYRLGNPEIAVNGKGLNITSGDATPGADDNTDFGSVAAGGSPMAHTFTITNTGPVSLALTGSPRVAISGSTAFSVTRQPDTATVAPGGSTVTFDVSFSASATGPQSATVTIASDDTDENPFTFAVSGTGPSPADAFYHAMTNAGLAGPTAAPDATPHGDGVNNLLKYAFNMNLADKDSRTMPPGGTAGLPTITTQPNTPAGILRFEFVRRIDSGLIYTPQKSPDPGNPASWVPLTGTPSVNAIDAAWERVIYEEPYDPAAAPRLFGRVQLRLP